MFSFGSKVKQKLTATRFEFSFVVHNLAPWPEGARAIAIGYQRGKRRRGATRSVYPSRQPGRLGAVVRFNERFDMPVTLYKASGGNAVGNGGLGPFKKKCLILAVLETDGRTQATAALGRIVVDLSEYAAVEHQETRTFMVSCNKTVHAAVGDPQLMVTIRCRWKKMREGSGATGANLPDETASMSTDTTGSRMTANLSSFLRFKFTGKGNGPLSEEQDLRGFESTGSGGLSSSGGSSGLTSNGGGRGSSLPGDTPQGLSKVMDTIQESHDEPAEPVFTSAMTPQPGSSRSMTPHASIKALTPNSSTTGQDLSQRSPLHAQRSSEMDSTRQALEAGVMGLSLRELHAARGARGALGGPSLVPAGSAQSLTGVIETELLSALRFELLTAAALEASVYFARRPPGAGLGSAGAAGRSDLAAVRSSGGPETASAGASFSSKAAAAGSSGGRGAHSPARRLVRTVVAMGPGDGPQFGASALRVVRAQVAAAPGDGLDVLSYWWSNVVHMRAMLASLPPSLGTGGVSSVSLGAAAAMPPPSAGGSEHWASAVLVPELRRLERMLFDEVLVRMWDRVLLPTVLSGRAGGASASGGSSIARPSSTAVTKRAQQEAAIKKWFEALEAVCGALNRHVGCVGGHAAMLRHQVLLQCLKRVDLLLFAHLLGGIGQPGVADLLADYDPHRTVAWTTAGGGGGGGIATAAGGFPHLDDASLPFARGVLTFGGGMSVKMTVTRLQQWATGQPALGGASTGPSGGAAAATAEAAAFGADRGGTGSGAGTVNSGAAALGPLFPLLRAAADLLMMPKELLLDRSVRLDVGAALSMRSVLHILERFKPDEFAQDSISPAILESLHEDAALPQMHLRTAAAADVNSGYLPPPDALLLRGVEAGTEPGLEYDADSEDEMEELAQVVAKSSIGVGSSSSGGLHSAGAAFSATRFRLLHEMWVSSAPRRRQAMSVTSEPT
ncbi:hypothetical protein PLESTB_001806600 [Pleodorina starrii]|uniref:C2 NT-type domain-containing protein n=1 Tax=Pleodorina starrii TaxID=330485 RepID=A0A9W6C132_9CHLO|nr:hypothetical protein PLESTM_001045900 [Pleodorina starrii]GLC61819.1 hypothetical protein PLESTB_001806600 [Pleodorina starrii]GLC69839.1 hypothetical protein PLESTF_000886200 [Pleodorina starrii]